MIESLPVHTPVESPVVLLVTPPLMQPNTPYPATAMLTGWLRQKGISTFQADLGIELLNRVFSRHGLSALFDEALKNQIIDLPPAIRRILALRQNYEDTIDLVMAFLRKPTPDIATRIVRGGWLPEGNRFQTSADLGFAFGTSGITDKAKFMATRYLHDLTDFVAQCITPHFGLIRYGERLAISLPSFNPMKQALIAQPSLPDKWMIELLENHLKSAKPHIVAFTVPFPGNLYGALRCAQHIRKHHPQTVTLMGGGYPTTELRQMTDPALFGFMHLVILDDGIQGLTRAIEMVQKNQNHPMPPSSAYFDGQQVVYTPPSPLPVDFAHWPGPDFSGLPHHLYFPLPDTTNPMHRLWSDGRWNKLTLAHGCYWHQCAFCDTRLDYIGRYEAGNASAIADTMQKVAEQTGSTGFHFTDEAAPPALLKALSLEILRRGMQVTWWGNIRFEKSFSPDLCRLMALAGCVAVTGGLETASNRLLKLMNKGVTLEQATHTCHNFTKAGIMVHAYLMYGFPTQTAQETIDSLEMVRQMFETGVVQSAFWHRFALTVHSLVNTHPERFGIAPQQARPNPFANNEVPFSEKNQTQHDEFGDGLRNALFNYMQQAGFEVPLNRWFGTRVPRTTHPPQLVALWCKTTPTTLPAPHSQLLWPGWPVTFAPTEKNLTTLLVETPTTTLKIKIPTRRATELTATLDEAGCKPMSVGQFVVKLRLTTSEADLLWTERWMVQLRQAGLLVV